MPVSEQKWYQFYKNPFQEDIITILLVKTGEKEEQVEFLKNEVQAGQKFYVIQQSDINTLLPFLQKSTAEKIALIESNYDGIGESEERLQSLRELFQSLSN